MMMENFMNGFPGRENQIRSALLKVLGKDKCDFFFDRFLEYFFTEKDAEYLASLGMNCIRLGFNYHHFEDDMNPFVIKEEGFKHLDRVIDTVCHHSHFGTSWIADGLQVCEEWNIHDFRFACLPWWPEPRLALCKSLFLAAFYFPLICW